MAAVCLLELHVAKIRDGFVVQCPAVRVGVRSAETGRHCAARSTAAGCASQHTHSSTGHAKPGHLVAGVAAVSGEALLQKRGAGAANSAGQARNHPVHSAARRETTRRQEGRLQSESAECSCSTGARLSSAPQYAGVPLASACHCGALKVTAETGSPMALTGISVPSFAAVQSALVMALAAGPDPELAAVGACWP